jgi:hypothetical protein
MTRIKKFREEWVDNFKWRQFYLRVILIFFGTLTGALYLQSLDSGLSFFDWLRALFAGVFTAAWTADAFIANPKYLAWDYARLRERLPSLNPQQEQTEEKTDV